MQRSIKTLLFSTLYPSAARPVHGIFVETRLRELLKTGAVETKVVAPVPWFPLTGERFGEYGKFAATPHFELRNGVEVFHPRYFLPPRVGMNMAPHTLARGALPTIRKLIRDGFDFDLIDAHYYYPDGVAAGFLAKVLGKPFVVTARGTDINVIPDYPLPRRLILNTSQAAAASIGVSRALMDKLAELGATREKLEVFRNGVDLERFHPLSRDTARQQIRICTAPEDRLILSVGNLVELKGHHLAIEALQKLPIETQLAIIGKGSDHSRLEALAHQLGVADRVHFAGVILPDELKWWYSAADVLVLCSSREGWPNVLLEAMACGTPVVATKVGGVAEMLTQGVGTLLPARSSAALASALENLLTASPDRQQIRRHAEKFSWDATSQAQLQLFRTISHA
jgi:teichuronic acid biosynthesis glycosyltransferase TuaC